MIFARIWWPNGENVGALRVLADYLIYRRVMSVGRDWLASAMALALVAPFIVVTLGLVIGFDTPVGHEGHAHVHLAGGQADDAQDGATTGEFPELSVGVAVFTNPTILGLLLICLAVIAVHVGWGAGLDSNQPRPPPR